MEMTDIHFSKWQGTGNDFIILDGRTKQFGNLSEEIIKKLCDRHFGIGADGLMILMNHPDLDFKMMYFNADGIEAEMCGNGARCMIGFAYQLGIIAEKTSFMAYDGIHAGRVLGEDKYQIKMIDVKEFKKADKHYFLNTGVPHLIVFIDDVDKVNMVEEGRMYRHSPEFSPEGTNVNFVQLVGNTIKMRTYERGVENETLSCGTGAVASAIATYLETNKKQTSFTCKVPGGQLKVTFEHLSSGKFCNIFLEGPAKQVFEGILKF